MDIFERCVNDSSEAIMVCNPAGTLVYVNPAWVRIYGYTAEEALGKTPRLLHSGVHDPSFYQEMWSKILNPNIGSWKGELVNKAKDGTLVPVLLTISPSRKPGSDEIAAYMGIAVDLTYRRELEAKLSHQDRLASIGLLASGLAHEIGTPLGVIRGRAELLAMGTPDYATRKGLGVITTEIDRISKLIRSLLRLSRSTSDVNLERLRPESVVNQVLALVGQSLRDEHIDIQVHLPEQLEVVADFGRLEQILLNLILNAVDAIRKAAAAGRSQGHALKISAARCSPTRVAVSVEDTGCGIAPENLNKLFKPFFTTKDIGEGTGLGLAIVAQLSKEIEGRISVKSKIDRGTTFNLELQG